MVDRVLALPEKSRIQILSPIVRRKKGSHKKVFAKIMREGYVRMRVDGEVMDATADYELDKNKAHDIDIVIDRIVVKPEAAVGYLTLLKRRCGFRKDTLMLTSLVAIHCVFGTFCLPDLRVYDW